MVSIDSEAFKESCSSIYVHAYVNVRLSPAPFFGVIARYATAY
jgi:hypothetical protein